MRQYMLIGVLLVALAVTSAPPGVPRANALGGLPAGFVEAGSIPGFDTPIAFDWTPDGRIFVGEKTGRLRLVKQGVLQTTSALTLTVSSNSERGLLGVAVDPRFPAQPYLYLYYTTAPGSLAYAGSPKNRISRFTVRDDGVDLQSEQILVDNIPSDAGNHNGGDLHFGPDGLLYASTGDGGANRSLAQNLDSLAGKILRVEPDTGAGVATNPFVTPGAGAERRRVWAYGLRNPFRFDIHPTTGAMIIADVGDDEWEELDQGRAGANYGWPQTEGPEPAGVADVDYPIFWYGRSGNADPSFNSCRSITGGAFVTGANLPASYADDYMFADYACKRVWRLPPNAQPVLFADAAGIPVHLAFGPDGALYYSDLASGSLRRIQHTYDIFLPVVQR